MNVHETLVDSIRKYPTLFRTGGDVMRHMFCVLGNGYHWVNGELVQYNGEPRQYQDQLTNDDVEHELNERLFGYSERARTYAEEFFREDILEGIQIAKNAENLANLRGFTDPIEGDYYMVNPNHYLYEFPDDIKPDWLEAALWMQESAKKAGWVQK